MKSGDWSHTASPSSVHYWYDDAEEGAESEAANSLAAQAAKLVGLKPFPVVAQSVMQMVASPDCNIAALTDVIRNDTAVAARVMRLANSALFRVGQPVDSIEQALMRLGTSTIYQLVTAIAVMGLFTGSNRPAARFRNHCTGVAAVGRALAQSQKWVGANQVFLCGLMHDLGKLLLLQVDELDYGDFSEADLEADASHAKERAMLGYDHAVLGAHVLNAWNLPEVVAHTVALHHQPQLAYTEEADPTLAQLVAYVRVANFIDHQLQHNTPWSPNLEKALGDGVDVARTDLSVDVIGGQWAQLAEARATAQAAFS